MVSNNTTKQSYLQIALFFVLTYAITWGLSAIVYYEEISKHLPEFLNSLARILTGYGPTISAIILVYIGSGGVRGIKNLLMRYTFWNGKIRYYIFALFVPILISVVSVIINVLLGGSIPGFFSAASVPEGNPIILIPIVFLIVFLQTGFAEETGWRGYALPALQQRFSPFVSSIILGVLWALWHFGPISNQISLGIWYVLSVIATTIILTWLYNRTQGSLLLSALFHTAINVTVWIIPTMPVVSNTLDMRLFHINTILYCLLAGILLISKYKEFSKGV